MRKRRCRKKRQLTNRLLFRSAPRRAYGFDERRLYVHLREIFATLVNVFYVAEFVTHLCAIVYVCVCVLVMSAKPINGGITRSRRLFVGNLSFATTWQNLKDHFQGHGTVVYSRIIMDNVLGRSKGYGSVSLLFALHSTRSDRSITRASWRTVRAMCCVCAINYVQHCRVRNGRTSTSCIGRDERQRVARSQSNAKEKEDALV